jgi:hypothetical protein
LHGVEKRRDLNTRIAEGKSSWSDPASSILFSLDTGARIGSAFGGDSLEVGCFDLFILPIPGRKANMLIKLVNPIPHLIPHSREKNKGG